MLKGLNLFLALTCTSPYFYSRGVQLQISQARSEDILVKLFHMDFFGDLFLSGRFNA